MLLKASDSSQYSCVNNYSGLKLTIYLSIYILKVA